MGVIVVSHRPVGLSEIKNMKYFLIKAGIGYDRPSTIFKILIFKIFIAPNMSKNYVKFQTFNLILHYLNKFDVAKNSLWPIIANTGLNQKIFHFFDFR